MRELPTRGWFALIVLLLVFPLPSMADDGCRENRFYQERGYPVDIEIAGDELWIADGAGLTVVDVSDPTDPIVNLSTFEEAPSRSVAQVSDHEAAILTDDRVRVYDLLTGEPSLAGEVVVAGSHLHRLGSKLVVVGKRVTLLRLTGSGLEEDTSVEIDDEPVTSAVIGNDLFVAVPGSGTLVLDQDLEQVARIGVTATAITGTEATAFLGRAADGIFAVDLSDRNEPRVIDHLSSGVVASQMVLEGTQLLATGGDGTVFVLDVSDTSEMELLRTVEVDLDVMASDGETLYTYSFTRDRFGTRFENGVYLAVRDQISPDLEVIGSLGRSTGPLSGVATDGPTAWIADPPFVRAIRLSSGEEAWRLRLDEPFDRIRFEDGRLITYGSTWVHLIEPGPEKGRLLGKWPTLGIKGGGVTFSGPWLIEANRASGFHVLDISDLPNIIQRGGLINDGRGQWMDVVGIPGAVYGVVNTGVKVVSLFDEPSDVSVVEFLPFGRTVDIEIATVGGEPHLVVLDGDRLRVHDLLNPLRPTEISSVEVLEGKQLAVSGSTVWALTEDARVVGVDLTDPAAPAPTRTLDGMREGLSIGAAGDVVAGADRWAIWAGALTPVEELEAPHLTPGDESRESVALEWSAPPVRSTEIQVALDPQFGQIEQTWTTFESTVEIERRSMPVWVRARFRTSCAAGTWSAGLEIEEKKPVRIRAVRRP